MLFFLGYIFCRNFATSKYIISNISIMKKATMNKALFGLVAFVAILFMGVTVTSCSNGDEVKEEKINSPIVGTWKMDEKMNEGGEEIPAVTPAPTQVYEVYSADGKYYKADAPDSNGKKMEEGTFTVKDNELVVEIANADQAKTKQTFTFEVKEEKLTKTNKETNEIANYTKVK